MTQPAFFDPTGTDTRNRIMRHALHLFAVHGYTKTSIRKIASEAGVNLAAVSYYFQDKAGLYRAVMSETCGDSAPLFAHLHDPALTLFEKLKLFFQDILLPLKMDTVLQDVMRLHCREVIEPSGMLDQLINEEIKPQHDALARVLAAELGVDDQNIEVQRIVVGCTGMAINLLMSLDMIQILAPAVVADESAIDEMAVRFAEYTYTLVQAQKEKSANA